MNFIRKIRIFDVSSSVISSDCQVRRFTFVFVHLRNGRSLYSDNSISFLSNPDRDLIASSYSYLVRDKMSYLGEYPRLYCLVIYYFL